MSCVLGGTGLALPAIVPPIRGYLGYPTYIFDGAKTMPGQRSYSEGTSELKLETEGMSAVVNTGSFRWEEEVGTGKPRRVSC
jgi:hypothetical protein